VIKEGRVLVDGALISKVPVGLLRRRSTCLKIAVNATSSKGIFSCDPESKSCVLGTMGGAIYDLQNTFELNKGINLGSIINHSWDLLSWSEASLEAARADISINPNTSNYSNFAFDNFDQLLEIGRSAARDKLNTIRAASRKVLEVDSYFV
jgi:predicted acylesterase/phospholipase RssA